MLLQRSLLALGLLIAGLGLSATPAGAVERAPVSNEAEFRAEVMFLAGNSSCPHTIRLEANITLVSNSDPEYWNSFGCPLTIDGNHDDQGADHTLHGNNNSRVITSIIPGAAPKLTLTDITITQGRSDESGGAVNWNGPVDLIDMVASYNVTQRADTTRGGFLEADAVTVTNSTLANNTATATGSTKNASGGAISADSLTADGLTATANQALGTDPTAAAASGGAVYVLGPADIDNSTFDANSASGTSNGQGGALQARDTIDIDGSIFKNNTAVGTTALADGGAIYAPNISTVATITGSSLVDNSATGASASSDGSAVDIVSGHLYLNNSTVTGNEMLGSAPGAAVNGQNVHLAHATVRSNHSGGAGTASNVAAIGEINSIASVVDDPDVGGFNCSKAANSSSYSWTDDTSCDFDDPTDTFDDGGDPVLGPLVGTPRVFTPGTGSPLINGVPASVCPVTTPQGDLTTDQLGTSRLATSGCDIGAVEVAKYRADNHIRRGSSAWVGNNRYNTTGNNQTRKGSVRKRGRATYYIRVQNDGNVVDSFKVKGGKHDRKWIVTYIAGGKNVSKAVKAGTYQAKNLAPGATKTVKMYVKAKKSAKKGNKKTVKVTSTSVAKPTSKDTVKAVTKRR